MRAAAVDVRSILTRSSGYLATVCSHSLQPYRGCALGNSLCGVACYVRHNVFVTRGEPWGSFVEARRNAAEAYVRQWEAERRWARSRPGGRFSIFLSSSTEPFQPLERTARVTRGVLEAMVGCPPGELILQTHSHRVAEYADLYATLKTRCALRVHVSIESDLDRLPGLPPPASSVAKRMAAARTIRDAGVRVVATVSPLLPIADPAGFFARLGDCADAVVIDHFIDGDGSPAGARTRRTALPLAMAAVDPRSVTIEYRDRMVDVAVSVLGAGRVGVGIDGFAGRMLEAAT